MVSCKRRSSGRCALLQVQGLPWPDMTLNSLPEPICPRPSDESSSLCLIGRYGDRGPCVRDRNRNQPHSPGATVASPVQYIATGSAPTCALGVGSMGIYVNNVQVYSSHGVAQINTQLPLNPGYNHTVVQEWDKCGHSSFTTINLTVATAPTATLAAAPTTVVAGNPAMLSWSTTNATAVSIAPGIGTVPASGSTTVTPSTTTEYTLTATGNSGTATASATVTVQSSAPTAMLSASPATITGGNTATLSWSTNNATTVSINQGIGIVSESGSAVVSPTSTTQYVLTATSDSGATATASSTVTVQTQGATNSPITNLVIVMMPNHSLDNLFGTYPGANGLNASLPSYFQVDAKGNTVSPTLVKSLEVGDPKHNRPTYIASWDKGLMDKFSYTNGDLAMQYYDNTIGGLASDNSSWSIGNIWSYVQQYALADNFFASAMNSEPAQEFYMVAATPFDLTTASSLPYYDPCSAVEQQKDGGSATSPLLSPRRRLATNSRQLRFPGAITRRITRIRKAGHALTTPRRKIPSSTSPARKTLPTFRTSRWRPSSPISTMAPFHLCCGFSRTEPRICIPAAAT